MKGGPLSECSSRFPLCLLLSHTDREPIRMKAMSKSQMPQTGEAGRCSCLSWSSLSLLTLLLLSLHNDKCIPCRNTSCIGEWPYLVLYIDKYAACCFSKHGHALSNTLPARCQSQHEYLQFSSPVGFHAGTREHECLIQQAPLQFSRLGELKPPARAAHRRSQHEYLRWNLQSG
jgi:hypothetical protein